MKIIVGLGNVGEKYLETRHNIGFITLDQLIHKLQIDTKWKEESKFKAAIIRTQINGKEVLLVKPTTLMNLSGQAVSKILKFYKLKPEEDLVVIYDDIDLPLGKIRIREQGSAGTHNGMKSIINELGTDQFTRIRIGIESRGETSPKQQDLSSYVLSNFTAEDMPVIRPAVEEAGEELMKLI